MSLTFIHSADWQLGKPYASIEDSNKRALLQNARVAVVERIGDLARKKKAAFVIVAGDLFDSPSASRDTVAAACSAIGALTIPVYVIPGNHDHGGPGSLWEQEFFLREQHQLAPNLRVLLKAEPVELEHAVLFPCPLLRRHEGQDLTTWLRKPDDLTAWFGDKVRIVIAHGSTQDFSGVADDGESDHGVPNLIDLTRLPTADLDYVALGDWHGTKQVGDKAWYPGTPEIDRFIKGSDHDPGNTLAVTAARGAVPKIERIRTGSVGWHDVDFGFSNDADIELLASRLRELIGQRVNCDLVRLQLTGSLGIAAYTHLEQELESWTARLLRLKVDNAVAVAPSASEIDELTRRVDDPLVSRVAARLVSLAAGSDEQAVIARVALCELHAACRSA